MDKITHSSSNASFDDSFYQPADLFFKNQQTALTYDDITLATGYSEVLPKQTSLETSLSDRLQLHIPILSSDMDTVTGANMAIAMALNGGLGLIHYNMAEDQQLKKVERVKHTIHGLIQNPITISPDLSIGDVIALKEERGFSFSTFPVVDGSKRLLGLLPGKVVKQRYAAVKVADAMTKREDVFTIADSEIAKDPIGKANAFFDKQMGIHKLLVVDKEDTLKGLFTFSDIERIVEETHSSVKPTRDAKFRLACGAAVSAPRTTSGTLDRDRFMTHIGRLVDAGLDAVAVSTAHGYTSGVGQVVSALRQEFKELTIIAGNVTSASGVEYLADMGADAIKIGQGPGSICTTRIVAGVGIPQMTALYVCAQAAAKKGVKILADGGITKSGDIVKALTLADAVICGGILASCTEAPGKIMEIDGKYYKEYRGMGSMEAMKAGSAARYGHESKDTQRKAAAEGIEALKEVSGPVGTILGKLTGGVQSGLGYLGAKNLEELKNKARYIRITPTGLKESNPHNVIEVKSPRQ